MAIQKITKIIGTGIVVRGNDIDTDRIVPARFLKEITFANMGKYAFYDERFDENGILKKHPFNEEKFKGASILAVNKNFGSGSSREHAPQALMRHGIKAIIGEGFADIFAGNCLMIGLPVAILSKNELDRLMEFIENHSKDEIIIDLAEKKLKYGDSITNLEINESARKSLLKGTWDSTSLMLEAEDKIKDIASRLLYVKNHPS